MLQIIVIALLESSLNTPSLTKILVKNPSVMWHIQLVSFDRDVIVTISARTYG